MKLPSANRFWVFCLAVLLMVVAAPPAAVAQQMEEVMIEQILRLEATLQVLKQGYTIVQKGLTVISDVKKGDFDLHSDFFNALLAVKPGISSDARAAEIVAMQLQIVLGCTSTLRQYIQSGAFSTGDLSYLSAVYTHLKDLTLKDVDELSDILSSDQWQMSDDQRLSRLDHLYKQVQEKYLFLKAFADRTRQEAQWRNREKLNLQNLSKLIQP
jgi:hypothetical protein